MSGGHQPGWERLLVWLVVGAISLQVLADVLPRLVPAVVVLAIVFVVVRLVIFHTGLKW